MTAYFLDFFLYDELQWSYCILTSKLSHATHNPNTIKCYKILQKLSPKHAAHGVAQSPYPIYRPGKACLSKQPPWRAAPDPRLARGRSRVRASGPAGARAARFFLHPPFLPPSGDSFVRIFPTKPTKVLGLNGTHFHDFCPFFGILKAAYIYRRGACDDAWAYL